MPWLRCSRRLVPVASLLAVALLVVTPPARAATGDLALVVTDAGSAAELRALVAVLERQGARVRHYFPPDAAIGEVPPDLDPEAIPALAGRLALLRHASDRPPARFAAPFERLRGPWLELGRPRPEGTGEPLVLDAMPGALGGPEEALPERCPVTGATSAYLLGDVSVGILLVESVNPAENLEDWSVAREDQVVAEIVAGGDQLALANPEAGLDFFYEVRRALPTEVEPISRSSGERSAWIADALGALGEPSTGQYVRNLRARHRSDWAIAAYVVDSLNDGDGKFTDGLFAFAYIGGPYMVMTWDNDGWGIGRMETVFAHELGHNFQALDEYASAGKACDLRSGVLRVENQNSDAFSCLSDVPCLMRSATFPTAWCEWSEGQLGLRDSDLDGVPDLRDQPPQSRLDPADPDPSPSPDVTLTGFATALPDPAEAPWPGAGHTLNEIATVEYRLDGGPWLEAVAVDGAWGDRCEDFTVPLAGLADGWHRVESRATSYLCDPADTDRCAPPRTRAEASLGVEDFYVNTDCAEDRFEPNDRRGEEVSLPAGTVDGLELCAFDPDRFQVYLRAGAALAARVEYVETAAALTLELRGPGDDLLAAAAGAAGVADVALAAAATTGWHALVVAGVGDAETAYRLLVTADCIDDGREPNPAGAPAALPPGPSRDLQLCAGDEDWYGLSLSAGAGLTVDLDHQAALGDLDLELLGPDRSLVDRSASGLDRETVAVAGATAGVHYLRVLGAAPAAENRYDLTVASDGCLDDLGENDDDEASARPGPGSVDGRLCPGDEDWVRLEVASPSLFRATVGFDPGPGTVELELRDAAGVVVGRASGSGGLRVVERERLLAGSYFLRLWSTAAAGHDYRLEIELGDPILLHAVRRGDDVELDWNDAGQDCYWLRRSTVKETFDGGFETVLDLAAAGDEGGEDVTRWTDPGRVGDGQLYFYTVLPTACGGTALSLAKTVEPYPIYLGANIGSTPPVYTLVVRNDGREAVSSIRVRDDIPPSFTAFRVLEIPAGATDSSSPTGGEWGHGYVLIEGFALAPGESGTIRFLADGPSSTSNSRALRNRATATGRAASGVPVDTVASDDPSTHATPDSTDLLGRQGWTALSVATLWNQDVDIDLRVVDPCGNAIGPADLASAECPAGRGSGTTLVAGGCGDPWPWGWSEEVAWIQNDVPAPGAYQVWLRYTDSNASSPGCAHGGLEDVVVLVDWRRDWFQRWVVLDPAETDWVLAAEFVMP